MAEEGIYGIRTFEAFFPGLTKKEVEKRVESDEFKGKKPVVVKLAVVPHDSETQGESR